MPDTTPSPSDNKTRRHVSEIPPTPSWVAQAAQVLPWLQRAMWTGFGDPTAYSKFKHPGEDVQLPPARSSGLGGKDTRQLMLEAFRK